jgi:hypothetical protein
MDVAALTNWITSLPAGTDVFSALKGLVEDSAYNAVREGSRRAAVLALVAIHALCVFNRAARRERSVS